MSRSRVPKKGISNLGITGNDSLLMLQWDLVILKLYHCLLEHGADPYEHDIAGNDAFHVCLDFRTHGQRQVLA